MKDFAQNRCFSKFCPKSLKIFKRFWLLLRFFKNFDQNRDVSNKIEVFRKLSPNLKLSRILKKKISYFSKILSKIDIFENVHQNQVFERFWPKSLFSKFWPKSRHFENFVCNQDFSKFFTIIEVYRGVSEIFSKINTFKGFDHNRYFSKIWPKSRRFENFDHNWDFRKFWSKSKYFENLHQNWDSQTFPPRSAFF